MIISWYGEACFLLESGGIRILIEPPNKESGLASPRLKSDVLIFSRSKKTADSALFEAAKSQTGEEAFIIDSAGEYEIKNVNIRGIDDGGNTMYSIDAEGIKVAHLGFFKKEPDDEKLEPLGDSDIVLIPIGGLNNEFLNAETAMKLINKMEPKIAIPMIYDVKGLKIKRAPLSAFIKESGAKDNPLPKLNIKKKDLAEEETKIVILEKI